MVTKVSFVSLICVGFWGSQQVVLRVYSWLGARGGGTGGARNQSLVGHVQGISFPTVLSLQPLGSFIFASKQFVNLRASS